MPLRKNRGVDVRNTELTGAAALHAIRSHHLGPAHQILMDNFGSRRLSTDYYKPCFCVSRRHR
jgi:hypothetical protein